MKKIVLILVLLTSFAFSAQQNAPLQPLSFAQIPYPLPMNTITVDGYKMAYGDNGIQGETVVFLHGWRNNLLAYAALYPGMKKANLRVIAIDYIGNGKSDKPTAPAFHTMAFKAKSVMLLMKKLGVNKAHLVGHSMGGVVASVFALTYPELTGSITLLGPAGMVKLTPQVIAAARTNYDIFANLTLSDNAGVFFYKWKPEWNKVLPILKRLALHPDAKKIKLASKYSFFSMLDTASTLADNLKKINAPVLVILGKQDRLVPGNNVPMETYTSVLKKNFKNVRIEILDECGHMIPMEQPEKTVQLITGFVAQR